TTPQDPVVADHSVKHDPPDAHRKHQGVSVGTCPQNGQLQSAIEHLDAFSSEGGTATLKGWRDLGWPEGNWAIDPTSADGGL
ncbi:hypothetical protein C6A85_12420, partial [Mycobacterium sp. ITM-2017-0098]